MDNNMDLYIWYMLEKVKKCLTEDRGMCIQKKILTHIIIPQQIYVSGP